MPQFTPTSSTNSHDKFYTRPETAEFCLAHLRDALPNLAADLWVAPSAGDGVFLDRLPHPRIGLDVAPDHPGI
uniref:hypothetical protein n=1 Tax=Escherichia coli TaxID=562 RepID=UPI000A876B61